MHSDGDLIDNRHTNIYLLDNDGDFGKKTFIARNSDRKIRLLNERVSPNIVGYNVQAVG